MANLPTNKVFTSPYKDEIEKRLVMGQSVRAISKWLKTRGEEISYQTINEYKKKYFNIESEAAKIVKDKQKELKEQLPETDNLEEIENAQRSLMETEMNMHLGKIRAVNHIAVLYENIHDMRLYLQKLQNYEPVVAAHAAKGLYQEIRATIETLENIKEREDGNDDSSVARLLANLKAERKRIQDMKKELDKNE